VQNNNNSKKSHKQKHKTNGSPTSENCSSITQGSIAEKKKTKSKEKLITDDIIKRVSRYQQHCQQIENSEYSEPKKQSESPKSNKISEATHIGINIK